MKHIAQYETLSALQDAINNNELETPWVTSVVENSTVQYSVSHETNETNYIAQYFTTIVKSDDTIFTLDNSSNPLKYSTDGQNWTEMSINGDICESESFSNGTKVYWKQSYENMGNVNSSYGIGVFNANNGFDVEGNLMSLLFDDNFENIIEMPTNEWDDSVASFRGLFSSIEGENNNNCENAENLVLNAVGNHIYQHLFYYNENLTKAPIITKFDINKYEMYAGMFTQTNIDNLKFLVDIRDYIEYDEYDNEYSFTEQFCQNIDGMLGNVALDLTLGTNDGTEYYSDNIDYIIETSSSSDGYYRGFNASAATVTFEKI